MTPEGDVKVIRDRNQLLTVDDSAAALDNLRRVEDSVKDVSRIASGGGSASTSTSTSLSTSSSLAVSGSGTAATSSARISSSTLPQVPSVPRVTTTTSTSTVTGTVTAYSSNGTGTATVSGVSTSFTNGTGITLLANDVIVLNKQGSTYYAVGLISRSGVGYPGSTSSSFFTPASAVAGLPYQPSVGITVFGAADGAVWGSTGTVVSYADATNYTITRPSTSWDNMWGLSDNPNGVWVFVNRSATSNGLHVIYNGSGTTHNYGTCQTLGTYDGKIWVWAGYKSGVVDRRLVSISSNGTVADYTNANLNDLSTGANSTYGVAGPWGVVLWDGADVVLYNGTTYTKYTSTNFPSLPTGATAYRERACMSSSHFFWLTGTTADRDYRRWEFSSAARSDFNDSLPSGFNHDSIATTGGTNAVIAGDNGTDQQYQLTSGSGVTTVTFTSTNATESFLVATTPTFEVIGRVQTDAGVSSIVGIS
jgi:hypothetical protein